MGTLTSTAHFDETVEFNLRKDVYQLFAFLRKMLHKTLDWNLQQGLEAVKRYESLMKDTWWAWLIILAFGLTLGLLLHPLFFSAVPIGVFSFFYFGMMRYDEDGNAREGL